MRIRQSQIIRAVALIAPLTLPVHRLACATEAPGPKFVLPADAEKLPLTGPKSFCRNPDTVRSILDSFSDTAAIKNAGQQAIDFINPTTTRIDAREKTFSCHGVMHISNGQMFPGTFSILNNAAGGSIWNWMNDDSSTPYNIAEFEKEFVCPESLQDDATRDNEARKFMKWVAATHPEANTLKGISELRVKLLQVHHCATTLANIRDSASDGMTDSEHVPTAVVARVVTQFKQTLRNGGMSAVSSAIQNCYDHAGPTKRAALAECILYDTAAHRLDSGMQTVETARGLSPSSAAPFLSDRAFAARMMLYAAPLFGSPQSVAAYFGDAPDTIVDAVTR